MDKFAVPSGAIAVVTFAHTKERMPELINLRAHHGERLIGIPSKLKESMKFFC